MPYAVGYARFSSTKQGNGSSLERQKELIAEWISRNPEYELYPKTFQDLGRSAFKGIHLKENHDFGKLLAAIEHKEIKSGDVILVEAIDRIGRLSETKMISLIHEILEAGIRIITLQDNCEYGPVIKSEQIWSLIGKIQQAHQYSKNLSFRISKSYEIREKLARSGIIPKRRTPIWLNSDGTIKPSIAAAIKSAFEDSLSGMGERRILRRLIEAEPAFKNKNPSTIQKWLKNKAAIGYWKDHKIYPSIVTDELFYQVQRKLEENYKPATAPTKNFLSGLVKCGNCGANMQVKANKHSPHTMNCSTRCKFGESRCSNGKSFPVPVLLHICNDTATLAVDQAIKNFQLSTNQKELIILDGKLTEITRKFTNLGLAIQTIGMTPEFEIQLIELKKERETLEIQKSAIKHTEPENQSTYEIAWDKQYELFEQDPMRLNSMLQSAGYKLTCFPNGTILSSTTGNQFSNCAYKGYDRTKQTYQIDVAEETFRIANRDGSLSTERFKRFLEILNQQRKPVRNTDETRTPDINTDDEKQMYELYKAIEQ